MTPPPFVLVDGSSYLFRAYYALPPLVNSKNQPTGAIYGVINMLERLVDTYQPTHMAVVFDAKGKNFRHDMYPEYKANRTKMPEELASQIPFLHQIIRAKGLPLVVQEGVEADDVIGTLAKQASKLGWKTVISTGDKDLAQLVDEHITLVNTMKDEVFDRQGVIDKFQVTPEQIIDYLSLIGDTSDNIKGVNKVGPKTAVKWLQKYGSLDNIIVHKEEISGVVGENFRHALEDVALARKLILIDQKVILHESPKELGLNNEDVETLRQYYQELEFKSKLQQLGSSATNHTQSKPKNYALVLTKQALDDWVEKIKASKIFAVDTETTSLNVRDAKLVGISLAVEPNEACYIPVAHNYLDAPKQLSGAHVLNALRPLLTSKKHAKVLHNLKYDKAIFANNGICLAGEIFDTMLESYVLNSTASRHDMDSLAEHYLQKKTITYEEVAGKGAKKITFDAVPLEQAAEYAAEDADMTLQLHQTFLPQLEENAKQYELFSTVDMPLVDVLYAMEQRGVLIDESLLHKQTKEIEISLEKLQKKAFDLAKSKFNLNSPKQLQVILYENLKLPVLQKTPKGAPSTSEAVLSDLALDYPLPQIILDYRSLSKLKSTYTEKLPQQIDTKTGRVHTSYHQATTSTGRLSSSDPNLQNIPIRTPEGRKIRQAFVAPEGYQIVAADYSQIELRIMAYLSQDEGLLDAFEKGLDIHKATAAQVFSTPIEDVTSDQRRSAKAVNFGLMYGMSAFGLAKQLKIDPKKAKEYMDKYFEQFPKVKAFMDSLKHQAENQGFVETLFGRRLYLPNANAKNFMLKQGALRAAVNAPMQGSNADIIKKAMIALHQKIQEENLAMSMLMQVHDELVFEVKASKIKIYSQLIETAMIEAGRPWLNLVVNIGVGDNWDEAH